MDSFQFLKTWFEQREILPTSSEAEVEVYTKKHQSTEQLDYCNAREWEGNSFLFIVTIKNDTLKKVSHECTNNLCTRGFNLINDYSQLFPAQNLKGTDIDRIIIEKYVREKK